jgi:GGDEF domain-containing protein
VGRDRYHASVEGVTREPIGGGATDDPGRLREEIARLQEEIGFLRLQLDAFSTVDPDTGALNRNGLIDAMEAALQRIDRLGEPFALSGVLLAGMSEADASDGGDRRELVRHVAAVIQASVRALDRVARLDERTLAVLSPGIPCEDRAIQLDRIRSVLSAGSPDVEARMAVLVVSTVPEAGAEELLAELTEALARAEPGRPELRCR